MRDFKDRVAVITGGGSGIGLALGKLLSRAGAHVVIADRMPDRIEIATKVVRETATGGVLGVLLELS